uniref:Uncharacterized protein n=1 Tax=Globodera rostochiensis TaxID=31243 RepID=A0A914I1W5_GLORO
MGRIPIPDIFGHKDIQRGTELKDQLLEAEHEQSSVAIKQPLREAHTEFQKSLCTYIGSQFQSGSQSPPGARNTKEETLMRTSKMCRAGYISRAGGGGSNDKRFAFGLTFLSFPRISNLSPHQFGEVPRIIANNNYLNNTSCRGFPRPGSGFFEPLRISEILIDNQNGQVGQFLATTFLFFVTAPIWMTRALRNGAPDLIYQLNNGLKFKNTKAIEHIGNVLTVEEDMICRRCGKQLEHIDELCYCPDSGEKGHHSSCCDNRKIKGSRPQGCKLAGRRQTGEPRRNHQGLPQTYDDLPPGQNPSGIAMSQLIIEANETLKDPHKKGIYDQQMYNYATGNHYQQGEPMDFAVVEPVFPKFGEVLKKNKCERLAEMMEQL